MACTHHHMGSNHNPGDTPEECSANCRGRVTYCGPDPDDPFSKGHYCEHEDEGATSTAGGPLNIPPDSVIHRAGEPKAWDHWTRFSPGSPPGMIRMRLVSDRYVDRNPFHSQNVPCNPDQVGSVPVSKSTQTTIKVNASVGGKIKGWIDAKLGVDIGQTVTITTGVTVYGEKCRSVDYKFYVRYNLWEVEYVEPDSTQGIVLIRIFVPIGFWTSKDYVTPTCCTARTAALFQRVDGLFGEAAGGGKYALAASGDAFLVARGCMVEPTDHTRAFESFGDALSMLQEAGMQTAPIHNIIDVTLDLLEEMTSETVKDLIKSWAETGDLDAFFAEPSVNEVQLLRRDLSMARTSGAEDPSATAAALGRTFRRAIALHVRAKNAVVYLDTENLSSKEDGIEQ